MMIPFVPTIALSFISFIASAFVILRIVIPILPPHPLSRRVAPSEFGLPNYNFRSLSSADKSHLWLTSLDLLALCVFIWQAASEYSGGAAGLADARDAAASARLWFALTIRQSCFLVVSGLTLIHIRMGRSVSFGRKHWMIWAPTLLLGLVSTTVAAVLAGVGVPSFFTGVVIYMAITVVLTTAAFGGLVYTLVVIKRNLAAMNEPTDNWPPVKEADEKPRPSFATEDIDALREGSSWLTSDVCSSRHETMSNWSFSTHHTRQGLNPQHSLQSKSSHWFNSSMSGTDPSIPPVPPLPSVYRGNPSSIRVMNEDPDPFRRDAPSRPRLGSQSSWLTSPSVSQVTLSTWSYPATSTTGAAVEVSAALHPHALSSRPATPMTSVVDLNAALLPQAGLSRPATPALSSARVLGGYGYTADSEAGIASLAVTGGEIDVSYVRYALWFLSIWVPFALSLPYLVSVATSSSASIKALPIMLVLSMTLSSPLLALNILVRSPIPIPAGLFGVHVEPPSVVMRAPSPTETLATYLREYKRSGSVTIVESRRSGDVWLSQGDAVDGKGKVGRALGLIAPLPRLAVLPLPEEQQDGEITPPLPMQEETFNTATPTPSSINDTELGRMRKESKASSYFSGDEAFATKIMIAQRHYSAVATTVVVPASPERTETPNGLRLATGVDVVPPVIPSSFHLRSRSVSSIGRGVAASDISTPPCEPLPPTPPNIRNAKHLLHRRSRSSDFSFGVTANDDIKEIDALTAGLLPLLVPGLKLGEEMKIRDWEEFSPPLSSTVTKRKVAPITQESAGLELGVLDRDNSFHLFHSTPAQGRRSRRGKVSGHKRNHFGLSSLGLDEDAAHTWKNDLNRALSTKVGQCADLPTGDTNQRNTVWGDEIVSNFLAHPVTESQVQQHAPTTGASFGRSVTTRNVGLRVEIPEVTNSARTSLATLIPPSATSTVTLFEAESIFEPVSQSTPYDPQKCQAAAMTETTSSRIAYIKSDDKPSELVTSATLAPSAVKPFESTVNVLYRKSPTSEITLTAQSGLRPLVLLMDRDTNEEGDLFKLAEMRPCLLSKKRQKLKVTPDENAAPNAGNKYLKPLRLRRSESSKMRGMLRRDEVLPTVIVRPPSTNAKMGSPYEYR